MYGIITKKKFLREIFVQFVNFNFKKSICSSWLAAVQKSKEEQKNTIENKNGGSNM